MPDCIYLVAGEASGDLHGAALLEALRLLDPNLEILGRGGPRMREIAGAQFRDWIADAAVVGLWEVVRRYGYFRREFRETLEEIATAKPDAIVLIDYPGFNLRLARALRDRAMHAKIVYYISPQVWAWNRRRIPQMARYLDRMLCIFPFEAELYNRSGLRTTFVGHPMVNRLARLRQNVAREADLVAILPGSRKREVRKILPVMLDAAAEISRTRPRTQFEIVAASAELKGEIERLLRASSLGTDRVTVIAGGASATMQRAQAGMIASGTATLEAAYFRLPFVLVYKVSWLTYLAARAVVNVRYLGMPNVLAGAEIVREFIQHRAKPAAIAQATLSLLNDSGARARLTSKFGSIIAGLGEADASRQAAEAIMAELH